MSCPHPASLVDLVPTLAGLTGVTPPPGLRGTDLSPLLRDPGSGPVQDEVLFTFDDMHAGTGKVREVVPAAGRIRCIREPRFKYARYFHAEGSFPAEFEMYDLARDPDELENLAHPDHPRYDDPKWPPSASVWRRSWPTRRSGWPARCRPERRSGSGMVAKVVVLALGAAFFPVLLACVAILSPGRNRAVDPRLLPRRPR